jgi:hypothetical protein
VLELLAALGMTDDGARELFETVLRDPQIHRHQFHLTDQQFAVVSAFFQQAIP